MADTMPPEWRAQLTEAFAVLLKRPLASYPDATYAAYAWGNFVQEVELDRHPGLLAPAVLAGDRVFADDNLVINDEHPPLRIDVSRSLFETPHGTVEGRDLATPPPKGWRVSAFRLASDGTLFDAMRAATAVGDGPTDLVEYEGGVDGEYAEALAGLDPALRAHLGWCCSDGLSGLPFFGPDPSFRMPKGTAVGVWEDQHGQWEMAVVMLA